MEKKGKKNVICIFMRLLAVPQHSEDRSFYLQMYFINLKVEIYTDCFTSNYKHDFHAHTS